MQSLKGLLPTDYPSLLAPWLVGGAAKMALNAYGKLGKSGLANHLPMVANLVISNVPGAPVPLYLAGARFLTFHPLSIIMHGLALNITIQTYAGHVDFGIVADKKALPHAKTLAKAIEGAFLEAQDLLGMPADPPTAAVKTPERRKVLVPKATKRTSLERPPSVKRGLLTDTISGARTTKTNRNISNAPSLSEPVQSAIKKTAAKKISRKTDA
jgi:diacylglycerol O-acyltransferase